MVHRLGALAVMGFVAVAMCLTVLGQASSDAPVVEHSGDLVLEGTQTLEISSEVYRQSGLIVIRGDAQLTLTDATLSMESLTPDVVLPTTEIRVEEHGKLIVRNSAINTPSEGTVLLTASTSAYVALDRMTTIAGGGVYLIALGGSHADISNSHLRWLDVREGATGSVQDSDLGGIGLFIYGNVRGLVLHDLAGGFVRDVVVPEDPQLGYQLTVRDSNVGGWWVDTYGGAGIVVRDSDLAGLTLNLNGATGEIADAKPGYYEQWSLQAQESDPRGISVTLERTNIQVWSLCFYTPGVDLVTRNCEFDEINVYGASGSLTLDRARVNNMRLTGTTLVLSASDASIGHSILLDHALVTLRGPVSFDKGAEVASWTASGVNRQYAVQALSADGTPLRGVAVIATSPDGGTITQPTGADGIALFDVMFRGGGIYSVWTFALGQGVNAPAATATLLTTTPLVLRER